MIPVSAIPRFENRMNTHSDMADNADIRRAIIGSVPKANEQCRELAKFFGRSSQRETCKAIFDYLKNQIRYVADGETQIIRLPSALLNTRTGDCKSYALFTSAVLTNLGIPHHFVMTSYNADPTPSHIYVATDDGCIIDAVWGTFDAEKKPTYRYEVKPNGKMRVKTMTGIRGCGCGCNAAGSCAIGGMGKTRDERRRDRQERRDARQQARQERRSDRKEANEGRSKGAKLVLAPGRNLFLVMTRWNLDGIATGLAKMNQSELYKFWKKAGGSTDKLQKAIDKGKGKRARRLGLLGRLKKKAGINGMGAVNSDALKAAIPAAATAAGAAVDAATAGATAGAGTASGVSLGAVLLAMLPIVEQLIKGSTDSQENIETYADGSIDPGTPEEQDNGSDSGSSNTMLIVGGIAAAAALFYFTRKK